MASRWQISGQVSRFNPSRPNWFLIYSLDNAGNGGSSSSGDVVSQILSKARPDALKIFSRWSTNKGWDSHVTANAASGSAGDASGGDACKGGLINIDSSESKRAEWLTSKSDRDGYR